MNIKLKFIKATEFKAHCLKIMDDVKEQKCEFVITKHGHKVAKLVPVESEEKEIFGCMKDSGETKGDIFSTGEIWDAEK